MTGSGRTASCGWSGAPRAVHAAVLTEEGSSLHDPRRGSRRVARALRLEARAHGPKTTQAHPQRSGGAAAPVANRYGGLLPQRSARHPGWQDRALLRRPAEGAKSVAVNIIYTSCTDECPLETARLAQLQRLLGARMGQGHLLLLDQHRPRDDTPAVLKAYMEKFGVGRAGPSSPATPRHPRGRPRSSASRATATAANKDGHTAILMVGDVPGGQWVRQSAVDNPEFLASSLATFFGWREMQGRKLYRGAAAQARGRESISSRAAAAPATASARATRWAGPARQ
jgi:hypothetical protein